MDPIPVAVQLKPDAQTQTNTNRHRQTDTDGPALRAVSARRRLPQRLDLRHERRVQPGIQQHTVANGHRPIAFGQPSEADAGVVLRGTQPTTE